MKGILIIGHGSREKSVERTLEAVVEMVQAKLPEKLFEIAYMALGQQTIPSGLTTLIEQGAGEITVVPYFLFNGIHLRKDIPEMIKAYQQAHPHVKIVMSRPLGADERLAAILVDRIQECP